MQKVYTLRSWCIIKEYDALFQEVETSMVSSSELNRKCVLSFLNNQTVCVINPVNH